MSSPPRHSLRLRAPAKVNWTLEVLGRRPDGYHEVRTILQTVALADGVTLRPSDDTSLTLSGDAGLLADGRTEENLAYRAAMRLRERAGQPGGVRIELEKRVPVAAGLGGGSSDAAAVLRGLPVLWQLDVSDGDLVSLAAELGADVAFFLRGGITFASGRGDLLEPLPDGPKRRLVVAWPLAGPPADKTARMYAALRPEHESDGARTERLAARLRAGAPIGEADLHNAFEAVLFAVDAEAARAFESARGLGLGEPRLAGSGPGFFFLLEREQRAAPLLEGLGRLGLRAVETHTLSSAEALAFSEVI